MLQKNITFAFIFCLLCVSKLNAQKNNLAFQYKAFIAAPATESSFIHTYICNASPALIKKYVANGQARLERQINDSVFIITVFEKWIVNDLTSILPANNKWKLSPALMAKVIDHSINYPSVFLAAVHDDDSFEKWAVQNNVPFKRTSAKNVFTIIVKKAASLDQLLSAEQLYHLATYNTSPKEELQLNTLDLSTNSINLLHNKKPFLNGGGIVLSVKEQSPDTTDIDIRGRYITNPLAAPVTSLHANIMCTMAAGAGNSWYLGKGVAWNSGITSSSSANLLPDPNANYQQYNISVQNHSYGVGVENFYGADAMAFDASAESNDRLLFVFSAGNSGLATSTTGNYAGINGFANLTGSFKMAKNIITVGATDSFYNVAPQSSKGPAYDGRLKPEMVAYGEDGSSGAAALVSGTAVLLQQAYKISNATLPSSSLVKAVLLNSCDDVAAAGIDFTSGFGSLNADKAMEGMNAQQYFTGNVGNGSSQLYAVTLPSNIAKAKFTLVWNDLPAPANAFTALQNDLDIVVKNISSGQTWKPWVLNSSSNRDSLLLLPVRKRDSLNTAEQVTIDNPAAGNYEIMVNGFQVNGSQDFSIAYQFDTASNFSWHFPARTDNIFPAASNLIRWESTFGAGTGILEYAIVGRPWQLINNSTNLSSKYYRWAAPDTNALALIRMNIGGQYFVSDTFSISAKPDISVGFNCADSVLLYWTKNKGISTYQLYGLGSRFLEPVTIVADTQFIFRKTSLPYQHFAVAPIISNRPGIKSYTIDYAEQGVECYVSNLVADLVNNNEANIHLTLGTTYLVSKIVFEKLAGNSFVALREINAIAGLDYTATDMQLVQGANIYRAAIHLADGRILYSYTVSVFFFDDKEVILYPNPVLQHSALNIQLKKLNNQLIKITDAAGRLIYSNRATATEFNLPMHFPSGIYLLTVTDEAEHIKQTFKLIVQ